MQYILSDHNCEGQAEEIFKILRYEGYTSWIEMELLLFHAVGLDISADDEKVWRLCQEKGYLLLTGNRTANDGEESLELTMRRLWQPDCLPVITISNLKRIIRLIQLTVDNVPSDWQKLYWICIYHLGHHVFIFHGSDTP